MSKLKEAIAASVEVELFPINPTGERVVIEQDEAQKEVKRNGIILPDEAKKRPAYGVIVAVGPGRLKDDGTRVRMTRSVGEHVVYAPYATTEIQWKEKTYLCCDESGILAVIPPAEKSA